MKEISRFEIENATIETLYWWNRDEYYYHTYYKKLNHIYQNKDLLKYFTSKVFEIMLREYSIRRNIAKGYKSVDNFIDEIASKSFFEKTLNGDTKIVDCTSNYLLASEKTLNKQTRSLLSKIAFLINPNKFSLYDTLAKKSLWKFLHENNKQSKKKISHKDINSYTNFIEQIEVLRKDISHKKLFIYAYDMLNNTEDSEANIYLKNNPNAFELRVIDKLLWLNEQNVNEQRNINHNNYFELLKIK